ncbi:MAG: hypothetical protein M3281_08345, partial [Chloroflexota bacterium]|nr:hypothetical protein [Chloroflexota bacterium]
GLGMLTRLPGWLLMGAGLAMVVPTLRRLLPVGTFSALPVLPATVAARGLFSTGFFTAETYVVLALTRLRGYPESTAGLMITAATLTWTASTWLHARLDDQDEGRGRRGRIFAGVAVLALGIIVVQPVAWTPNLVVPLAVAGHAVAGLGMGMAHPATGLVAFARSTEGAEGQLSSYLLVADQFTPAAGIGLGGALVALANPTGPGLSTGVGSALVLSLVLVLLGLAAAYRLAREASPVPVLR